MARVLVTGASGFIGSNLSRMALAWGHRVLGTYCGHAAAVKGTESAYLDVTNAEECGRLVLAFRPDVVVHNAACASSYVCTVKPALGRAVNVGGTANVVAAARTVGAKLVYVSTDYVFDGTKPHPTKYMEDDPKGPVNDYGQFKLEGEVLVIDSGLPYLITRPARVFGVNWSTPLSSTGEVPEPWIRASSTYRLVARLRAGEHVRLSEHSYQTPTFATEYGELVFKLLDRGLTGCYHVACPDKGLNRWEFPLIVASIMGLDGSLVGRCAPEETEEARRLPDGLTLRLPANVALDSRKVERALGVRIMPLAESLARFRDEVRQVEVGQEG